MIDRIRKDIHKTLQSLDDIITAAGDRSLVVEESLVVPPLLVDYDEKVITQENAVRGDEPKPRLWLNIDSRSEVGV